MTDFVEEQIIQFKGKTFSSPEQVEDWIRSLASTLIERVGSELIGEDETIQGYCHQSGGGCSCGHVARNQMRYSQRTKLQEMK